jgi:16S rRNA (adenine1518-N6/adenine1519-N6)-dimethyltransferase
VDGNILRAIVDQAAVEPGDVVLEVGAAGGLLTRPLLERVRIVHAFEIDGRFFGRLDELGATHDGLRLHRGDALKSDLAALDPPPTALVANLAYNIAIPLVMTTIRELPSLRRWGVMVQRELGERLFATPSTKAYSAVSVLVQLACRREQSRPVPPSAFRPRPRVESAFVTFVRRGGGEGAALSHADYVAMGTLVRRAFGQRRKVLTSTLAGSSRGGLSLARDDVRAALAQLGLPPAARPEELSPPLWVALARTLGWLDTTEEE